MLLGRRLPRLLPRQQGDREHAQRERGHRQTGLHRVVFEDHLQVDRQRDHHAAQGDLLEHLLGDAELEVLGLEQRGVQQCRLLLPGAAP